MKLRLIKTYKKNVAMRDENGTVIIDGMGREKTTRATRFLYGITDATVAERRAYKEFRNQDGDYYREQNGIPLYHSTEFFGKEVNLDMYETEDGYGFSADNTETDVLETMMNDAIAKGQTQLAAAFAQQIATAKLSGKRLNLKSSEKEEEEVEDEETETNLNEN